MSKRGLGRGLSALIPSGVPDEGGDAHEMPLAQIQPNPKQPRTDMNEDGIAELSDSVKKVGIIQPILVRPHGDGYQIIAGERRWRAAKAAGLETVPVRVMAATDESSLELALIENLQRSDLNAIEEARGYRRLLTECQMTQAELADKVSKSRSAVTNALRLLDLPEDVQEFVYDGKLTAGHARAILTVPDEGMRMKLA
ncbi:MAG: ParB/RepB/Spo0J family partition protein [Armatimonadota bacterium]